MGNTFPQMVENVVGTKLSTFVAVCCESHGSSAVNLLVGLFGEAKKEHFVAFVRLV